MVKFREYLYIANTYFSFIRKVYIRLVYSRLFHFEFYNCNDMFDRNCSHFTELSNGGRLSLLIGWSRVFNETFMVGSTVEKVPTKAINLRKLTLWTHDFDYLSCCVRSST